MTLIATTPSTPKTPPATPCVSSKSSPEFTFIHPSMVEEGTSPPNVELEPIIDVGTYIRPSTPPVHRTRHPTAQSTPDITYPTTQSTSGMKLPELIKDNRMKVEYLVNIQAHCIELENENRRLVEDLEYERSVFEQALTCRKCQEEKFRSHPNHVSCAMTKGRDLRRSQISRGYQKNYGNYENYRRK